MSTATPDFSTMSAAQIREFIESQPQEATSEPEPEQPRDDKGRFVAREETPELEVEAEAAPEPEAEAAAEGEAEPEVIVEECEIDLGDGSGVQLFRGTGATREEALLALNEQLRTAQINATKKIRELAQRKPEVKDPSLTPDQELALSQRLLSNPSEVLREEREKAKREALEQIKREQEAAEQQLKEEVAFMEATPDFYACPKNAQRIKRWFELNNFSERIATSEDIRKAYEDLKADGLIVPKPVEKPATPAPRSSGLSVRRAAPPAPAVDPRKEAEKLTLEQLREKAGGYINVYN